MADIALSVTFSKPLNLTGYTKEFVANYAKTVNGIVPKYSKRFESAFEDTHEIQDSGLKDRRLPPDYSGATFRSIKAKVFKLDPESKNIQPIVRVGYDDRKFTKTMRKYVPAMESGWGPLGTRPFSNLPPSKGRSNKVAPVSKKGQNLLKGKGGDRFTRRNSLNANSINRLRESYTRAFYDKEGKPKSYPVKVPTSPLITDKGKPYYRGFIYKKSVSGPYFSTDNKKGKQYPFKSSVKMDSEWERSLKMWAIKKLGFPTDFEQNPKGEYMKRWMGLKKSVMAGAPGRNVVKRFAISGQSERIWDDISREVSADLRTRFTHVPARKVFTSEYRIRGS